ncbi:MULTISPECIES: hypothetical protein [Alkalimonas]|uniref:Uncharacterized protein n=1 Tax=Alkalimonas mucilaginosa TaxID=3057676 RepID=A0ABU7JGJ2_9GAMM|nr:hypothetical protein [Alkalimonas sp. MEB004]MEE2024804.1 hypothetical protein [Alkalimonas sp. MEB004]
MNITSKFKLVVAFVLGAFLAWGATTYYFVARLMVTQTIYAVNNSVDYYVVASRQRSYDEIVLILNSRISCALDELELIKESNWPLMSVDEHYHDQIDKAYKLRQVPCDHPFRLNND